MCVQKDARDAWVCLDVCVRYLVVLTGLYCGVWLCLDVCVRYLVVLTGLYLSNPGQPKAPSGARKAK